MSKTLRSPQSPNGGEATLAVALLGLLAAVTVPAHEPRTPDDDRRAFAMTASLAVMRNAVDAFAAEHSSTRRALDATARERLSQGAPTLEPYLRLSKLPLNPINLQRTLTIVDAMPNEPLAAPVGWLLCPSTGEVRANVAALAPDGTPYFEL